jgi:hypothetical protein
VNFVAIPFFGFSQADSAGPAGLSYFEIFSRKWMPVNAMGSFAVDCCRTRTSKDMFFGGKDFEMFRVNASRRLANMVQMPVFRNGLSEHQTMDTVGFPFDLDLGISTRGEGPSPEPAPTVWLYLVFFLKHLLSISAFL